MSKNKERRKLNYEHLNDIMPDVDRLINDGHRTVGHWCLGQICKHLTEALVMSVDGFDVKAPWILRKTVAPFVFRSLMKNRAMPENAPLPDWAVPKPGLDPRAEAEALRAAIAGFQTAPEPLAEHPFFGRLSRKEWTAFHEIHCGHHLSFVVPGER